MRIIKFLKLIFINLILLILLLFILEVLSFIKLAETYNEKLDVYNTFEYFKYKRIYNKTRENNPYKFRPIEYRNPHKRPILLFGCSYTYGHTLKDNETLSRKLEDYTNRTVINRGFNGEGASLIYFQASDPIIMKNIERSLIPPKTKEKDVNTDFEYIIYTFISGHPKRNFLYKINIFDRYFNLRYELKNNKLERRIIKHTLLHSSYTFKLFYNFINNKFIPSNTYQELVFKAEIEESFKLLKKYYPNSKIAIIIYPDGQNDIYINKASQILKDFKDVTFIKVADYIPDIYDDKYWLYNHPSPYALDKLVPIIAKELNINKN